MTKPPSLFEEYAPDLLDEERPDGREYVTGDLRVLHPSIDLIDGVTYLGAHRKFYADQEIGRGKKKKTVRVPGIGAIVVTSNREWYPYTLYDLNKRGWTMPTTASPPEHRRWSEASMDAFLTGKDKPWSPVTLFTRIREVYDRYIRFTDPAYLDLMPLYIMLSYVFRAFTAVPYLHFNGTAGSGKTQNLMVLSALGFNTTMSSNISTAALFRTVAGWPGLVCADEFETSSREEMEPLMSVFRSGYKRGAPAIRTQKDADEGFVVANFNVFGPKAIASINQLEPKIRERCLVVATRKTLDKVPHFDDERREWQDIRDQLHLFTLYYQAQVAVLAETWNIDETKRDRLTPGLDGRPWELAFPLVVLAELIDETTLLPDLVAWLTEYNKRTTAAEAALDKTRLVLLTLPTILREHLGATSKANEYKLSAIRTAVLNRMEEDQKDKFASTTLAATLRNYGFPTFRGGEGTVARVTEDMIRRAFAEQRLEPLEDDLAWFAGTERLTPEYIPDTPSGIWKD